MRVLVAGSDHVDAGKTTFSTGLMTYAGATGFKPRAGNDYWFDHDDYRRAVSDGRLYGKDAKRLAAAGDADLRPEEINPVHRLWRPAPGPDRGLVGRQDREFVLDRIGDDFVVNDDATVPDLAREHLPVADAHRIDSVAGLNDLVERRYLDALADLAARIEACDAAVVESYGDVARPIDDLSVDAVAVVEPSRVRVYDGDRYARAIRVATGPSGGGRLEHRVDDVIQPLDHEAAVDLPALRDDDRATPAAVADAYRPAYDAVLDAADG